MDSPLSRKARLPILPSLSSLFKPSSKKSITSAEDPTTEATYPLSSRPSLKTEEKLEGSSDLLKGSERLSTQDSMKHTKKKKNVVFNEEREYLKTPPKKSGGTTDSQRPAKKGILIRRRLLSDQIVSINKDSTAENSEIINTSIVQSEEKTRRTNRDPVKEVVTEEKRPPSPAQKLDASSLMNSFVEAFERPRSDSADKVRFALPSTPDILDQTALFRGSKNLIGKSVPSLFKPTFTKSDAISLFRGPTQNEEGKNQQLKSALFNLKDTANPAVNSQEGNPPAFNIGSVRKEEQSLAKLLNIGITHEPKTAKEIFSQLKAERLEYEKQQKLDSPFESFTKKHIKSNSLSESNRSNFVLAASSMLKPDQFKLPNLTPFAQKPALISSFQASTPNPQFLGTPKKI